MNETEYLLTVLGEECAEAAQRCSKAIRFGLSEVQPGQAEDNRRRLEGELADLMATAGLLGLRVRDEDKSAKVEKLTRYMEYSRRIGTLDDGDGRVNDSLRRHLFCEGCGCVRERCPRIVPNPPALACCPDCSHAVNVVENRRDGLPTARDLKIQRAAREFAEGVHGTDGLEPCVACGTRKASGYMCPKCFGERA